MLTIDDKELADKLRQIAAQENRPVQEVIWTMVERYPVQAPAETETSATPEAPASGNGRYAEADRPAAQDLLLSSDNPYAWQPPDPTTDWDEYYSERNIRRRTYNRARRYWYSVGDVEHLALSDEVLDEQFGAFDEEGIPRLKSELKSQEPPVGSLAYAGKIIREGGAIENLGGSLDVTRADDVLNEEFAEYLLNRIRGEDVPGQNTGG